MFDSPPPRSRIGTVDFDPLLGELLRPPHRRRGRGLAVAVKEGTLAVHYDGTLIVFFAPNNRAHALELAARPSIRLLVPELAAEVAAQG